MQTIYKEISKVEQAYAGHRYWEMAGFCDVSCYIASY